MGSIIAWPADSLPTTSGIWLECNGQSCASYPKLVAILGANTVPDYRGTFLRGYGQQYSYHYGTVLHSSASLGELQGDAIRNIYGNMTGSASTSVGIWDSGDGAFYNMNGGLQSVEHSGNWFSYVCSAMGFQASKVVPTANENRPLNRAVRWLIKAT